MEQRRNGGLGCVVAGLGLILMCCLLPYLISSIYSIIGTLLQTPGGFPWLWGEWMNRLAGESNLLYVVLTEGPICCVGTIALLVLILGVVLILGGSGRQQTDQIEEEEVSPDEPVEDSPEFGLYGTGS
jgi:hypothetical protein